MGSPSCGHPRLTSTSQRPSAVRATPTAPVVSVTGNLSPPFAHRKCTRNWLETRKGFCRPPSARGPQGSHTEPRLNRIGDNTLFLHKSALARLFISVVHNFLLILTTVRPLCESYVRYIVLSTCDAGADHCQEIVHLMVAPGLHQPKRL
jgi:hypothetical protein